VVLPFKALAARQFSAGERKRDAATAVQGDIFIGLLNLVTQPEKYPVPNI
jgi:hypothetical protein